MEHTPARHPLRTGAALVGALALLTACGGADGEGQNSTTSSSASSSTSGSATSSQSPSESESAAEEVVITISDFTYSVPDSVPAGAEITVTNSDEVGHTVTADEGDTFNVAVPPGATVIFTAPESAGEYAFHCIPHPNMTSTLVVE